MKISALMAGLGLAVVLTFAGGHASAQTKTDQSYAKSINQVFVTVQPGDYLSNIATAQKTTYVRIFDANSIIKDPNLIYPGQKLRIPSADEKLPNRALPSDVAAAQVAGPAAQTYSAPASQPAASVKPATNPLPLSGGAISGCGDNAYAHFIYSHESGCRTTAMSPNGCYGIGQACPASKIYYCGADYACQNAFFTAYAGKYGGWAGAYNFWVAHGWW